VTQGNPSNEKEPSFWSAVFSGAGDDFRSSLWFALFGGVLGGGVLAWLAYRFFGFEFLPIVIAFGIGFIIGAIVSFFLYHTSSIFD